MPKLFDIAVEVTVVYGTKLSPQKIGMPDATALWTAGEIADASAGVMKIAAGLEATKAVIWSDCRFTS